MLVAAVACVVATVAFHWMATVLGWWFFGDFPDHWTILGVAMLTSKGASGITGAGFITLAATLAVVPTIPVAGMALILGIDRFMSECRALTNFIGNGVATLVVSNWEKELNHDTLHKELNNPGSTVTDPDLMPLHRAAH